MTDQCIRPPEGEDDTQQPLFAEDVSPAADWDRDVAKHTLDELFSLARQYRSSREYQELLRFVGRFHFYAPFNAMLVHHPGLKEFVSVEA